MSTRKRTALIVTLSVVAAMLLLTALAFAFGVPQSPPAPTPAAVPAAGGQVSPARDVVAGADVASPALTGEEGTPAVPAPDPNSPLAIQIPGCRCHSDDPEVVERHATYRMNQCFGCHTGGMPEMER